MSRSTFTFQLICASFWYFHYNVIESNAENALLYSLAKITKTLDETETPCLTACPATDKTEKKFNDEVSISGKSLFLRELYQIHDLPQDIQLDICDRPYQPAIIYNSKLEKYHIGYELYYYENEGDLKIQSVYENYYDRFRSVNVSSYDKITHSSKPQGDFFSKYIDEGTKTKFKLADGHKTLVFFWIRLFIVDYSIYKKKIELSYNAHIDDGLKHDLNSTCDIFNLEDEDMKGYFDEKNQEESLKNLFVQIPEKPPTLPTPPATSTSKAAPIEEVLENLLGPIETSSMTQTHPGNNSQSTLVSTSTCLPPTPPPISCGQAYGCFEKSQVIPLWYFRSRSTRMASCMFMNIIPVWKTIADEQLKKVDLNIVEMLNKWRRGLKLDEDRTFGSIIYGTWRWLKLPTKVDPKTPQPVFLSDPKLNQTIPVPRIIYRIVSVWSRGVAIIVHNDLSPVPQIDRLCKNESHGWQITNEDWTTGLTYTCPLTKDLDCKLGGNVFDADRYFSVLQGVPEHWQILLRDYRKMRN